MSGDPDVGPKCRPIKTVIIKAAHIALMKRRRFIAQNPITAKEYASRKTLGWLKPKMEFRFRTEIEIEPYAGIYRGSYRAGRGGLHSHGLCTIGSFSYSWSPLPEDLVVGRHCSIGDDLRFLDSQHPIDRLTTGHASWRKSPAIWLALNDVGQAKKFDFPSFDITGGKPYPVIGHDVWIGQNVTLSLGITIGHGAIIAANSTLTKSVGPYEIWGGNPARLIRRRFRDEIVARLLASEWWSYDWRAFLDLPTDDIPAFLDLFDERRATLQPYRPDILRLPGDFL